MQSYVLMIQTDPDDQYITESALTEIGASIPVRFISSVAELGDTITSTGEPSVILLNDRGVFHNGAQVLKELKGDSSYRHIPVVILGEVSSADHIRQYYRNGANTFITKPSSVEGTRKKIETFFKYWFDVAETPVS
jgi:CheY-like chemotaxis protein